MESGQADDGPDTEEADDTHNDAGWGMSHSIKKVCLIRSRIVSCDISVLGVIISHLRPLFSGEQYEVGDGADEDKDAVEGERYEEEIEVSVVSLPHTVAYPGAVVVEPLHAVVTDGAVAGARWPEYLAGEAELELHGLTFHLTIKWFLSVSVITAREGSAHLNLLGPGWWSVGRPHPIAGLLDLSLDILRLRYGGSDMTTMGNLNTSGSWQLLPWYYPRV